MTTPATAPAAVARHVTRGSFYRPELDCLRFYAFMMVFCFHAFPRNVGGFAGHHLSRPLAHLLVAATDAGAYGVNLFFVLSSYLISTLLLREREINGQISLRSFYIRRILRIWPLYFLSIAVGILWRFVDRPAALENNFALAYLLLAGNWAGILWGGTASFLYPLWSISLEEQFYLSWPALLRKMELRGALWFAFALGATGTIGCGLVSKFGIPAAGATFSQFSSISAGILLAFCPLRLQNRWQRAAAALAGATCLLTTGIVSNLNLLSSAFAPPWDWASSLTVALGAGLVFLSVSSSNLHLPTLRYLGKVSYGLYVWHAFCLYLVAHIMKTTAGLPRFCLFFVVSLAATILLSAASYRFFESPFLRLKDRFAVVHSRPI